MKDWIAKKFRAGRFSMNLQLLETDLSTASPRQVAEVICAAAGMIEKLRGDDFVTGVRLSKAATDSGSADPDEALFFYNSLEDILGATESHRKQVMKQLSAHGGMASAEVDLQARLQQSGLRLLMVSLARKIDDDFKLKARSLREKLFEARSEIPGAVQAMSAKAELVRGATVHGEPQDFEGIQTTAELFAFTFLGW